MRVAASIGFAALHTSAEFREQMAKAQAEFAEKTGYTGINEVKPADNKAINNDLTYTISGTLATKDSQGVLIRNGQKFIK